MEEVVKESFTRYADNEAMNEHMKEQLLEDDPMADYFKTKKHKVQMKTGLGRLFYLCEILSIALHFISFFYYKHHIRFCFLT